MRHLIRRFFGALLSRRLGPEEQAWVNRILRADLARLFWQQAAIDQRHAYEVARRTEQALGPDISALTAALLHDVGKRHSRAGVIGRSLATITDTLRLPLTADWRRYRDHEQLGAKELAERGADPLAVAFAAGLRPPADEVETEVWEALISADNA
jgi:putative nucleotidyltransferase with HDIG domain